MCALLLSDQKEWKLQEHSAEELQTPGKKPGILNLHVQKDALPYIKAKSNIYTAVSHLTVANLSNDNNFYH